MRTQQLAPLRVSIDRNAQYAYIAVSPLCFPLDPLQPAPPPLRVNLDNPPHYRLPFHGSTPPDCLRLAQKSAVHHSTLSLKPSCMT
ncbi:hypothetical protein NMY22_g16113 [Coprinellus aureogranulatus]|nr:hypothetical protein NMY22_g16113 [Coprinellus aureogranulatus]